MAAEQDITLKTILDHLQALRNDLTGRMDRLEKRFDRLEQRMDTLEKRMDTIEKKMDSIESKMQSVEKRMDVLEQNMNVLQKTVQGMDLKLTNHMDSIDRTEIYIARQKRRLPSKLGNHEKRIKKLEHEVFVAA